MKNNKIVIAAGGTGGHLFPASFIKKELENLGFKVFLITDKRGTRFSYAFENISIITGGGMSGESFFYRLRSLCKLALGFIQTFFHLIKINPVAVLGMGGYISVPVIIWGKILRKKTFIHNADSILGNANQLLSRFADFTCLSFEKTKKIPTKANTIFTGLPLRPEIQKLTDINFINPSKTNEINIVIMGGSQGAELFSKIIPNAISMLNKNILGKLHIYQQTIENDIKYVKNFYKKLNIAATIEPFFKNPEQLLKIATIFIARAGASTILEVGTIGRPSIFIPILHKDKQQYINAEQITNNGGGYIIDQNDLTSEILYEKLNDMLSDFKKLEKMAKNARVFAVKNNASKNIANLIASNI